MPRVSVLVPTFNCAQFLGRALGSALAQTYTDHEVIVVDDGSTDETWDVVAQFASQVRYFYQANRGPTPARNLALSQASGELIAYLDADDLWVPNKLEVQVAFLDRHKDCGFVHSDVTIIDVTDRVIRQRSNQETRRQVPQGYCTLDLLRWNHIELSSVVARRECLERTGGFDQRVQGAADYLQWILVAMDGMAVGYIDEALAMFRWRRGSLQSNRRRVLEELVMMFNILLKEEALALRLGQEATDIVRARLYTLQHELAYLDRTEGRTDDARRRVISLIRDWPLQADLYVQLVKACVPPALATRLKTWREGLA